MLDLSKNNLAEQAEAGYEFELLLPGTKDKTGAFVKVRGSNSKVVRAYARKKYQEMQLRDKMAKRKGKDDEMTIEEAEDLAIESAVMRVIGWKGIAEDNKEIAFSKENAERVLREHSWIREQIMEESEDLLNFRPD